MMRLMFIALLLACGGDKVSDTGISGDSAEAALASYVVRGQVVDIEGTPIPQAMVMVGGKSKEHVLSDQDGFFELLYEVQIKGEPAIVAAKSGYRASGLEYFKPDQSLLLRLRPINPSDNIDYNFMESGDGFDALNEDCSHCHTTFVAEFQASKHADSAENPLLHDLYAGVSSRYGDQVSCEAAGGRWRLGVEPGAADSHVFKCYLGGGVLDALNDNCGDFSQAVCDAPNLQASEKPTAFGACADCHAPGIDGVAGGRDLHEAIGLSYTDGVHCDVCHKVSDIDMSKPPGVGQRLILGRPSEPGMLTFEWMPVFYGPLVDVPNVIMGGAWQPKFNDSMFCAGCHEQNQKALIPGQSLDSSKWPDGLPIHTTFSEWEAGPYNQEETTCQFCHMPANTERTNSVDIATENNVSITFGFPREPEDNRRHTFKGPLDGEARLIDSAVYVSLDTGIESGQLTVSTSVSNFGCGHALPTGEPMRAIHLIVSVAGDCGVLSPLSGPVLPDTAGVIAECTQGEDCQLSGNTLAWNIGSDLVQPGQRLRMVRLTGDYIDYVGHGVFGESTMTPEEKGMPLMNHKGEATILSVDGGLLQLDVALNALPGDLFFLGDAYEGSLVDGEPALHLAGLPGQSFSKVLLDESGARHVPHYMAVDIASDNRLPPGSNVVLEHVYDLPDNCSTGSVSAQLIYRPIPLILAEPRAWESIDYVIAEAQRDY